MLGTVALVAQVVHVYYFSGTTPACGRSKVRDFKNRVLPGLYKTSLLDWVVP